MFRSIRRKDRALDRAETEKILQNAKFGVLSVRGDDGYPYGVPINCAYIDGKIYCHSAPEGHKIDAIRRDDKVCFTIVSENELDPERLSTVYASAIVFGRARIIADAEEKRALVVKMTRAISEVAYEAVMKKSCVEAVASYEIIEIAPERATGKGRKRPS